MGSSQFSRKIPDNLIRRDIEVVITGLTRNQFAGNSTRVRIPLSALDEDDHEKSDRLFLVQILIIETKPLKRNGRSIEMEYHDKQTGKNIDVFTTILYNKLRTGSVNKYLTEES